MRKLRKMLRQIIDKAKNFGLPDKDLNNSEEYFKEGEFGLCWATIVEQMDEYNIAIDDEFYQLVATIGEAMLLPEKDYSYLKRLIK